MWVDLDKYIYSYIFLKHLITEIHKTLTFARVSTSGHEESKWWRIAGCFDMETVGWQE